MLPVPQFRARSSNSFIVISDFSFSFVNCKRWCKFFACDILGVSLPRCKVENIEEVNSALDILDKYNFAIMPCEKSDDVNLHKYDIGSNLLNLNKFDSNWVSRSFPP